MMDDANALCRPGIERWATKTQPTLPRFIGNVQRHRRAGDNQGPLNPGVPVINLTTYANAAKNTSYSDAYAQISGPQVNAAHRAATPAAARLTDGLVIAPAGETFALGLSSAFAKSFKADAEALRAEAKGLRGEAADIAAAAQAQAEALGVAAAAAAAIPVVGPVIAALLLAIAAQIAAIAQLETAALEKQAAAKEQEAAASTGPSHTRHKITDP